MEIIGIIIFGLIAGALGKLIMPGDDPGGIIVTIIIGIVGAVLGSLLFNAIGVGGDDPGFLTRLIGAVIGVLILLGIYRAVAGNRSSGRTSARH